MEKILEFKGRDRPDENIKPRQRLESISRKDIAIIGMSGVFGSEENIEAFWEGLKRGKDFVCEVSEERKKECESYISVLGTLGVPSEDIEYPQGAFMNRIDTFDCRMFNISPMEADLMDPHQRILLQVMWQTVEDAGYGGRRLSGSRTGIYVGHSTDFGEEYKRYSRMVSSSNEEAAVTGNIRSVIASRLAYILDLKGPSITIDTACSSALMAVHTACQAIRLGECDMALAGAAKVLVVPIRENKGQGNIGIGSSTSRARTFDDSSDGTGIGEGAGAVLLKPLSKAMEDGDNIYAVIRGSASNQDGSSVGITAPNMAAQEEVILRAWKNADIDPQTVTYIETHGTGTRLGDPIEIGGIERAFEHYTDKKQFCAVASVKTNIGHLDHAAGIASLIKAAMALKHGELPPSLHFERPNRKIPFEDSPVYVNDTLSAWEGLEFPRRCGISSFGLSGTNCHMVLEEYNAQQSSATKALKEKHYPNIFVLSARSIDSLSELVDRYNELYQKPSALKAEDICFTSATGRGHYNIRLAIAVKNEWELKDRLNSIKGCNPADISSKGIFFGQHKIVSASKSVKDVGEITESDKKALSEEAGRLVEGILKAEGSEDTGEMAERLCGAYVMGADVEWERLYSRSKYKKVSLPAYPFLKERHWVKPGNFHIVPQSHSAEHIGHPILDACLVSSMDSDIYSTMFSVDRHWVLNEHKIAGNYVVPGTAYIEIAREIASRYNSQDAVELTEVIFITPLAAEKGSPVEAQIIVREGKDRRDFAVVSRSGHEGGWVRHVEGSFSFAGKEKLPKYDMEQLKKRFSSEQDIDYTDMMQAVEVGPRFMNMKKVYIGDKEALGYFELPEAYSGDMDEYYLHPAIMDSAVNMVNDQVGEGLYLPLSYKKLKIYGRMPSKIYSYIRKSGQKEESSETGTFEIALIDTDGNVFARVDYYTVKKVHFAEARKPVEKEPDFYYTGWMPEPAQHTGLLTDGAAVLVFKDSRGLAEEISDILRNKGVKVYEVEAGDGYAAKDEYRYAVGQAQEDYDKLISATAGKVGTVLHMLSIDEAHNLDPADKNGENVERGIDSLFFLTKALIGQKAGNINLTVITDYAFEVSGDEPCIKPHNAALLGFARVAANEYEALGLRGLDIDDGMSAGDILNLLDSSGAGSFAAYRNGIRYVEELRKADAEAIGNNRVQIKEDGVYIITGGAGGIGLEIARYFSSQNNVRLCLINRTPIPERNEWDGITEENKHFKLCRLINTIREIEASGSRVVHYSADVADIGALREVISEVRQEFGSINGVIHAAGVAGDGFIINKEKEALHAVISPKIAGTAFLAKLTEEDNLDFFVMFSSISSLLAAPGQSDYTAANTYMDAYAGYMLKKGRRAAAIGWPAWSETGMAVDYNAVGEDDVFLPISTAAAIKAFERLISSGMARVIPSKINYAILAGAQGELPVALSEEIQSEVEKNSRSKSPNAVTPAAAVGTGVVLKGRVGQSYTQTEYELAGIWSTVLGIQDVDIFDNFSNVGGDSILATRLLREMQKKYGGLVDISDVFTYSTINEMAQYIDSRNGNAGELEMEDEGNDGDNEPDSSLDDVLEKLSKGEMSIEEAEKLINLGMDEDESD
ncbi:phosphopantetheine binding protein [Anaerobacterium chartisolvens]|uniref:Phosphopantetheine binding protein n=1 Tax=Anaerobacterium chartisolvens TaxID=1297424 RepID=A0A369AEH7_9FIRM|nr:SDR family NAD(P)-dependent oxidoreductase [Anaerobacterium chartisolvens]RCX07581.1 phosphopantetheine binding protein [Anaerobacterium chartisolvens]